MPNQEHLDILKKGVVTWNKWREKYDIRPDLSNADLSGAVLTRADLFETNLSGANLRDAHLVRVDLGFANLSKADLSSANLSSADLSIADLSFANLNEANLFNASLLNADLTRANLELANLIHAVLTEANFKAASVGGTIFGEVDLSTVKGLDTVEHDGPSTIGIDTIYLSHGNISEVFLRKAGVQESFLTNMPALVDLMRPIDFYSCFISYSSKDQSFAERLYADLLSKGVRCFYAPEDLKWGAKTRTGIDEAIHLRDKLLLILSKHSIASGWVEHEVKKAMAKERREKRVVLFPIRLDQAVLDSPLSWVTKIRHERNIGNFSSWKNHDSYQAAFDRLLRDLKAS